MKVYFNLEKRAITDVDNENQVIFTGDVLTSELQVISNTPTTDYYVTVSAKLSNGRTIGPFLADVGGIITDEHSTTWKYTLSSDNGFTLAKGITNFYIWLMPVDCTNKSQKCLGAVVVNVGEAFEFGDDYFIAVDEEDEEQCFINMKAQVKQLQQLINSVTTIVANPEETASTDLNKVKIGSVTYSLADLGARSSINAINGKIPSEASSLNKLADKKYVDDADEALQNDIDDAKDEIVNINKKIPSAASQNNQLADKQYVDNALSQLSSELQDSIGDVEESVGELQDSKQDNINDLAAIRSGASAGATAYQKPSGGIPKADLAQAVQTSLNKADVSASIAYVDNAIGNLPEPMIFKGTLGTGGTITSLPTASSSNEGFTYKVITAGTYASQSAKVGDVFVSTGSMWVLIPAGDDAEDTWRAIQVNGNSFLGNGVSSGVVNFTSGDEIELTPSGHTIRVSRKDVYQFDSSQKTMNEFFTLMLGVDTTTRLYDTYDKKELIAYRFTGGATGFYVSFVDDTLGPATLLWTADAVSGVANRSVHETLYIGLNATSGDYLLKKVNKVSGMGLSHNDFTNTDKANISKSLYHLGAFDSNNGKTRQTGYEKISDFTWEKISNNRYSTSLPSALPTADTDVSSIVFSETFTAETPNHVYSNVAENIACINSGKLFIVYVSATYYANHTAEQFVADYGNITFQYKLATSYTDTPIEGESILPLDSNMANKIRQKVVDGLNLINMPDKTMTGSGYVVTTNELRDYIFSSGTYTFSFYLNGTTSQTQIIICNLNNELVTSPVFYATTGERTEVTFTVNEPCYIYEYYVNGSGTYSNFMLVQANHPYPYSPFNQKEHITNDEATLLKQEEEKCRNLLELKQFIVQHNDRGTTVSISGNTLNVTTTSSGGNGIYLPISIKAGKTYTISFTTNVSLSDIYLSQYAYESNYMQAVQTSGVASGSYTFTANANYDYIRFWFSQEKTYNVSNIMLNEGSEAKPYQEWNGPIVHEKDLEPTLLWENGSPNSAFSGITTTLPSTNYKYFIIEYRNYAGGSLNYAYEYKKFKIFSDTYGTVMRLECNDIVSYKRKIIITPTNNSLIIDPCTPVDTDEDEENGYLVPTAIYGSNV